MKFRRAYQIGLNGIERVAVFVVTCLMGLLLLNETLGIASNLLGYPIPWTSEVSVLLFAWVVFLGAAIIARHGGHIALDIITYRLPLKYHLYLRILAVILSLVVTSVMVYYGIKLAVFAGRRQTALYSGISFLYFYLSIPTSGLLMGLNYIGWLFYKPTSDRKALKGEQVNQNPLY